jgi:hypothetical protein
MTSPAYIAARITPFVAQPRWGGGVHESHLREFLGVDHPTLRAALMICYRRKTIDCCWRYVVVPAPASGQEATAA